MLALLGYVDEFTWFKICAELDPVGTLRVVSVELVTVHPTIATDGPSPLQVSSCAAPD